MTELPTGRLEGLTARFRLVLTRRSSLALGVSGDPGVGKSFEVKQLLDSVGCQHFTMNANATVLEWLRGLPRPDKLPFWALRAVQRLEQAESLETSAVCAAITSLLLALSPVVWVLEDVHEADSDRLGFLGDLARAVKRTRGIALVLTSRVALPEPFEVFQLQALSSKTSKTLLEQTLGAPVPSQTAVWIEARACGNPLFALEYLRYLARTGHLWSDGQAWHWREPPESTMPATIEALIERLLEQAKNAVGQEALEAAAVLLPKTPAAIWAHVAGLSLEALAEQQTDLERHGLFRAGWFAHPLFREVAARGLSSERRRDLARRAVSALEVNDPQTAAAYVDTAQLEDEVALVLLERAAKEARNRGNTIGAARFTAQAANRATGDTRDRLALEAAIELQEADLPYAQRLLEQIVIAGSNEPRALYLLAELLARQGRGIEAEKMLARVAQVNRDPSDHIRQQLRVRTLAQDFAGVIALYEQHATLLETANAELLNQIAWSFFLQGDAERANTIILRSLENPDLIDLDKADLSSVLAMLENARGNQTRAETLLNDAINAYREAGRNIALSETLYNRARAHHSAGRYRDAMTDLEQAAQLEAERGDGHAQAITQIFMAELQTEFGEFATAEQLLIAAKAILEHHGDWAALVACEANLSLLYRAWDSPYGGVLALKYAQTALKLAHQTDQQMLLLQALKAAASAEAWSAQGTRALEYAHQALEIANALAQPKALVWARATLALALESTGAAEQAQIEYQAAIDLAEQINLGFEVNRYGLEVDRLTHDTASAKQRLDWFQAHGLQHCAKLSQKYFPELNVFENQPATATSVVVPRLEVLGSMQLRQDQTSQAIRGHKRKELLVLLLEARISGKPEIPQFELCENLYPESNPEESGVSLKQLVFQIRSGFGQAAISTTSNGYALGAFDSDAEAFLQSGNSQLWRGIYLEDAAPEPRDETVSDALYGALRSKIESLSQTDTKEAARLGRILLEAEPYDLEVLRLCLSALRNEKNHRTLSRVYASACTRMLEVGEVLPSDWQAFLKPSTA